MNHQKRKKGEGGPRDPDPGVPKREKVPWDLWTSTGHHNCEKLGLSCSLDEVLSSLGGGSSPWRCLHQFSEASAGPGWSLDGICSFRKSPPTSPRKMPCLFLWIERFTCNIFARSLSASASTQHSKELASHQNLRGSQTAIALHGGRVISSLIRRVAWIDPVEARGYFHTLCRCSWLWCWK